MARRLAERGVRFTQIFHRGWDTHGNLPKRMKILCEELSISRQTVYNWKNNLRLKDLIAGYIKREGKKDLFDVARLKNLIRQNGGLFSNGKDHKYRDAVRTDEDKRHRVLSRIAVKIHDSDRLSEEEKQYFFDEKGSELYDPDLID